MGWSSRRSIPSAWFCASSADPVSGDEWRPGTDGTGRARWLYSILARRSCSSGDSFEASSDRLAPTAMPRCTAGRAPSLLKPALEIWEFLDVLALRLPVHRPRIADHIGDGILVAGQVLAFVQPVVQHAVQPVDLVGEAAHGIGLVALLVAEPAEMPALARSSAPGWPSARSATR